MIAFWPSVQEERRMALRREIRRWPLADRPAILVRLITPWRSHGLLLSAVSFVFTILAVVALHTFLRALEMPAGVLAMVLALAVAEGLILGRKWFGTGVESALWLGGLLEGVFALEQRGPELILLSAVAAVLAAVRVRSPWFAALAALLVVTYLGAEQWWIPALGVGMLLALGAVAGLRRTWLRPSSERALWGVLFAAPAAAAYATGPHLAPWWSLAHLLLAAICLWLGIRWRHHALLCAALLNAAIFGLETHNELALAMEWKLMIAGIVLLAIAGVVAWRLRERTEGIVVTAHSLTPLDDSLPLVAAAAAAPAAPPASEPQRSQGGGSFGGAGASGEF